MYKIPSIPVKNSLKPVQVEVILSNSLSGLLTRVGKPD